MAIDLVAAFGAIAILIVLVIAASWVWYQIGWTSFSGSLGSSMSWAPSSGKSIANLRFKDCIYTVTRLDGVTRTVDVTGTLNSMAAAYKVTQPNQVLPASLALDAPLNTFSFLIPGFNDQVSAGSPTGYPWCSAPPTMVAPNVCAGSTVTLTGKYCTV